MELVGKLGEALPLCRQVDFYDERKEIVLQHPVDHVANVAMSILRKRDRVKKDGAYQSIPYSLRSLVYFTNLTRRERQRFFDLASVSPLTM
jgi:hypothetical protein